MKKSHSRILCCNKHLLNRGRIVLKKVEKVLAAEVNTVGLEVVY